MAIDFPNSPTTNQTYTVGSNTWSYDGEKWVLVSQNIALDDLSNVTVPSPTNGDLIQWNGTAWVNVASSTVGATNLDGLTDVVITSATNGQILVYNGTNWVNTVRPSNEPMGHENKDDSVISFNEGTRTFSIAPASTSYTVWCAGKRFVKTGTETVQIPDTSGLYYIYFSSSGVLSYRTSFFVWDTDAPTAYIYWNEVDNKAYFFADERHGITLDWATHEYLHRTRGAAIANGFGVSNYSIVGDGSSDAHAKFDLAGGTFFDEDLQVDIVHSNTPTANTWEQVLEDNAEIPVFYRLNNHWTKDTATEFAFKQGTSRPKYNLNTAGTWSTTDIDNNKFAISWIIATNNLTQPVLAIMGQDSYNNIGQAEAAVWEGLNLDGFPIVEFRPLHKVVFQGTNSFTNSVNAAIRGIYDLRRVSSNGSAIPSTPVSDHGSMTGLGDDDHTQYLTDARHDVLDHSTAMSTVVLDDINNVTAPTPSSGDFLKWNGTAWVNDAIDLGTDTVGNYVQNLVAGTGITLTNGTASEGGTPTVAVTANTYQPLDGDLTAIAGLAGTSGVLKKTAADTWALDTSTFVTTSDTGSVTSTMIANGTIVDADINASAGIALSKLATSTAGNIIVYNASGVPTSVAETGDITISDTGVTAIASGVIVNANINASAAIDKTKISGTAITAGDTGTVTSTMIADGTIVNDDINASAAIAHSKLANATAGQVLIGTTTTGVVTATTLTGDVTVTGGGVTAIGSGVIVDADINSAAAIALSKLSTTGASTGNVITYNGSTWTAASAASGGGAVATSTTASVNTIITVDSFSKTVSRSAEFTVQVTQGTKYTTVKALVLHDGTTAQLVQYGLIEIGSPAITLTLSADISGSDVRLRATITNAATTNATVKVLKTAIAI